MHGPSTRVIETGLKYYIDAIGRSSGGIQLTVSGRQHRHSSKESEGDQWTYRMNYWATAAEAVVQAEHRHRNRTFSV